MVTNPLVKSVAVVTATWWTALTLTSNEPLSGFAKVTTSLAGSITAALAGLSTVFMILHIGRYFAKDNIKGTENRGLSISMGKLPVGIGQPDRVKGATIEDDETRLSQWYRLAKTKYPAHAQVFEACLQIYARNHDLPASPVRVGHGGVPLFDHALHVAEVTLELAETWNYDGERTQKGDLRLPLSDPEYVFNRHDPLIPVLAIAHDIGKIECYSQEDGKIKEFRQDHDMVSGLMLSRTPETWLLDTDDRNDLLLAVSHYHHPSYLPTHASDRVRAIMGLLIAADVKASTEEGIPDIAKAWKELAEQPTDNELIWQVFGDILAAPGSINGQDRDNRIGYKNGAFLYLFEEKTRHAVAKAIGNDRAAEKRSRMKDGRYRVTDSLMESLEANGLLYSTHKGKKYSHAKALFKVTFTDPRNADYSVTVPAVIILKLGNPLLSRFDKYPDSRLQPSKVEPLFSPAAGKVIENNDDHEAAKSEQCATEVKVEQEPPATHGTAATDTEPAPPTAPASTPPAPKRHDKVTNNPVVPKEVLAQMSDPMKSLELLMRATGSAKKSDSKQSEPISIPETVTAAIARVHASLEGGMVQYVANDKDGFVYIKRNQVVEDMMTDEDRAWIENTKHPKVKFKASDKASYLVVGNDVFKS